eukprot:c5526_g1_i1 orf=3-437(-)
MLSQASFRCESNLCISLNRRSHLGTSAISGSGHSAFQGRTFSQPTNVRVTHCARKGRISMSGNTYGRFYRRTGSLSLYGILGVDPRVSVSEIKRAYRQMAKRYHPDVCCAFDKENSTQIFLQVQEAYEILSDPDLRASYDHNLLH